VSANRLVRQRQSTRSVYPRGMAGKPAEPPHPDRPAGSEPLAAGASGDGRELEHTGPIAIERHVKDDGRSLILYSDERCDEDAPASA
jgi:hypothetical protein